MRHLVAGLDLTTGEIIYRVQDRKRWQELLAFRKVLRRRWPAKRLYVVLDNFSPHKHPEVIAWCADHDVELVFLPTYTCWLNWIEGEFTAIRYFALAGTDHHSHAEQDAPSAPTSAGATTAPPRNEASPSAPRSATPIT